ncbi:MAG: FAD-dependent oxidoreductase [Planctomycetota bacterium]
MRLCFAYLIILVLLGGSLRADSVLVEAESFPDLGGWKLDTQFIDEMGSPYLLAHGLGKPVENAKTSVQFKQPGTYQVWVRTKDWVARWNAKGSPGKFKISVDGELLETTFGTQGAQWAWQDGGQVTVGESATIELKDLTGFDGRCDAIFFAADGETPPNDGSLAQWRRDQLNLGDGPQVLKDYDLVVVGGGYSGMGSAISAARMGCKVALIQNRGVLGGNGSSEVRVWAKGNIRRGKYPRIGEIIDEFADKASKSPGTYEEFGDQLKEDIVRSEPNIDLFLNHHVYAASAKENRVVSVTAFDTRTSQEKVFEGALFVDCTGHGTLGYLVEADWEMTPEGRMGMSNMWAWDEKASPTMFPNTDDWALDLNMADFPYPRDHHGQWFWESGFDKDPINDAEGIRDWNLRAVYGAFNAMKNRDGAARHVTAILTWVAYVGGPRESRRLLGDIQLTEEDIVSKKDFPDGTVPSTWSIDLHYPKEQYSKKFPENPFISKAVHGRGVDRNYGYPVPYRCFYSRNIDNLFMAGRCVSVTHEALGTVRVMKTCGMMGEVVGKAASICRSRGCDPRDVYEKYLGELDELLKLPGGARRMTLSDPVVMPEVIPDLPVQKKPIKLAGMVRDDQDALKLGDWKFGSGLDGYVGTGYAYSGGDSGATMIFKFKVRSTGRYDIRIGWRHHKNRASNAKVTVTAGKLYEDYVVDEKFKVNMKVAPKIDGTTESLGKFDFDADTIIEVTFDAEKADGNICADVVQILPVKK